MPDADPHVPTPPRGRRLRARDALAVIGVAVLVLLLFKGASIRHSANEMEPGVERDVVLAVGRPAGWLADQLPLQDIGDKATNWLASDSDDASNEAGFDSAAAPVAGGTANTTIGPNSFDPVELGQKGVKRPKLKTLLATGDSMVQPLDTELARRLAGQGVKVTREPHLGTGISKSGFVDWGKLSAKQAKSQHPDAVVVFIGANEGFELPGPKGRKYACCDPNWAAAYANRVRRMMDNYRRHSRAVYWLTLPFPRDPRRQAVARAVNAAIEVASVPFRNQVRVIDFQQTFTPNEKYRAAMNVDGDNRIVREPDGIHLNGDGAKVAADQLVPAIEKDFSR
jgi:hypothetical protein